MISAVSILQGIIENDSATTHQRNFKTTTSRGASRGTTSEAKGVCNHQGWARRLRDLDVRGGAAEGTAP